MTLPRLPTRASVDPYRKLIERERNNNVAEVKGKSGPGRAIREACSLAGAVRRDRQRAGFMNS